MIVTNKLRQHVINKSEKTKYFFHSYPEELLLILSEDMDHEKKQVIVVHPAT